MSNEKTAYNQPTEKYDAETLTHAHSSEPTASDIQKMKNMYLPSSKAEYRPSEESIENANNLNYSKPDSCM